MDAPAPPRSPPPWAVPWEGAGPVPRVPALAAPLLARREAQRLLLELRRARPLPGLNHLKRLRGGPGRVPAVLLCLEADVPPPEEWEGSEGDGAPRDVTNDITNDTSDITDILGDVTDAPGAAADVTRTGSAPPIVTQGSSDVTRSADDVVSATDDITGATSGTSLVTKGTRAVTDDITNITDDVSATRGASIAAKDTNDITDDVTHITDDVSSTTSGASMAPKDTNDITADVTNITDDVSSTSRGASIATEDTNDITNDVTDDVGSATRGASIAAKDTNDITDDVADIADDVSSASRGAPVAPEDVTDDVTNAASPPPLPPLRVLLGPTVSPRGLGPPFRVLVPGRAPHPGPETAAALAAELWPWVLRGPPQGPAPPSPPPPLHPQELPAVAGAMAAAVAAALRGVSAGMVPAGGAVLDPGTGRVVAAAGDGRRGGHPLGHATMRCLEAVARCRRRGGGYLCQGWDVVLTREPCALCAMALVLARARRVLFGAPAPQGALSTRYGLHGRARLNHRYRAYGGVAPRVWAPLRGGAGADR